MQRSFRFALLSAVLLVLGLLIGPAGAQKTPSIPQTGPCAPGAVYDPACDVDHDNDVDIFDIQLAAGHWNQSGTWTGGDFWALTGNTGTAAGTHFLGTTDMEPLELRVAGLRALRLEPVPVPPEGVPAGGGQTPNVIGGHAANAVTPYVQGAAIGGGGTLANANRVTDDFGTVGGGVGNHTGDDLGTLSDHAYATVGGGINNSATGEASTVGGGGSNMASGESAVVSGGGWNGVHGDYATIAGGRFHTVNGDYAAVGGGYLNQAAGKYATAAGGASNWASGEGATVAGGASNRASGDYSLVAGRRAKADHTGAFVWADATDADFASTANNQFLVRAAGGVGINTNAPSAALAVDGGNSVARIAVNSNTPTANAGLSLRQDGVTRWSIATVFADGDLTFFREGAGGGSRLFVDGGGANAGYVGIGNAAPQYPLHMASGAYVTAGGIWTNASSRQLKADFAAIDRTALLEALANLSIETWSYRAEDPAVRHLGPTAEDFYAAFGLGQDRTAIGTVDADGVALATIQALYALAQQQQAQLAAQQGRIAALEARLAAAPVADPTPALPWPLLAGVLAAGLAYWRWRVCAARTAPPAPNRRPVQVAPGGFPSGV